MTKVGLVIPATLTQSHFLNSLRQKDASSLASNYQPEIGSTRRNHYQMRTMKHSAPARERIRLKALLRSKALRFCTFKFSRPVPIALADITSSDVLRDRVDYVSPHIIKAWIEAAAHAAEDLNIASPQPEWSLSLLNFNVLGCNLLSWEGAKFSQRMAEVLKLIRALSHDIVLIQEGWGEAGAALVRETRYPYTYSADKGGELLRGLIKGSGIHILSRFRILTARYCTFKRRPGLEWLGQKGYLVVEIDHPVAGRLRVVTGHFASPGEGIQRYLVSDRQTDLARLDNFQQMQNHLSMLEGADPCQTIIGGDFNVSNIHDERALSTLGDDVYHLRFDESSLLPYQKRELQRSQMTFRKDNPMAKGKMEADMRFDRFVLRGFSHAYHRLAVALSPVAFEGSPLSDHNALSFSLTSYPEYEIQNDSQDVRGNSLEEVAAA